MLATPDLVRNVEAVTRIYRVRKDPAMAVELMQALGWNAEDARLESSGELLGARQFRLVLAGETAGIFVAGSPENGVVPSAVNVAYNSGVDWAIVTDFADTRVVNARWYEQPQLFSLTWREYRPNIERLALLSPDSLIGGHLDHAARQHAPVKVLQPIDRHLTGMLETWRRLLLSSSAGSTDEAVHRLVGRLLFIRSCEDRGILPREGLLHLRDDALQRGSVSNELADLFSQLARDFRAELFLDERDSGGFDDSILAQVISELYRPYPLLPQYRYDFAYLNVDVLGKVYERYVSTILDRVPPSSDQPRLFPSFGDDTEVEFRPRRREQGIYYTPPFIVNYLIQHTVEQILATTSKAPSVADISCGSGAFLTRAAERIARHLSEAKAHGNLRRRAVGQVRGIDLDPRAVTLARVNLWILASMGEPPRPLPELGSSITVADALTDSSVDALRGKFDVVVGNPPFRSSVELDETYQDRLRARYGSARGRFDLAYVFAERALELVRPGGFIGLVLPNRLFTASGARAIRELLVREAVIEKIVDFSDQSAFEEGTSYVSLVIARRRDEVVRTEDVHSPVQVHRILDLAEFPGLQLRRADIAGNRPYRDNWSEIGPSPQPEGRGPWIWSSSSAEDRVALKLETDTVPLSSIADVYQGVKTGDNRIFLLTLEAADRGPGLWSFRNGLGEHLELEPDLLRPAARGPVIRKFGITPQDRREYVLYPHLGGRLLQLFEIEASFPATFDYIERHKDRLLSRSTNRRGRPWHDLAWSRADRWIDQPKILARELMPEAEFALDVSGQFVPIGGIAVLPRDANTSLALLLAVLNSSVMTWYVSRESVRFRGGHMKIVPGVLQRFHFPWTTLFEEPALAARIGSLALGAVEARRLGLASHEEQAEIDAMLFDIIGLDDEEQAAIRHRIAGTLTADVELREPWMERLDPAVAVVNRVISANTPAGRRLALSSLRAVLARTLTLSSGHDQQVLLTMAIVAAEQLGRLEATVRQLAVLRDLVEAIEGRNEDADAYAFARRLQAEGIEVIPRIAQASSRLAVGSSDDE